MSDKQKPLSRTVTEKNVQVKPATTTPISHYAPPKPAQTVTRAEKNPSNSKASN